ncbi:MAG: glutamine-hydrolyzing carbamoyl-phosphate synthase small subunit [Candidatus Micrarchaeia archaeon]
MVYLAFLYLEDGRVIPGRGFGAEAIRAGELVFTTSMNGYPESISDPSYRGQVLLFTHPLIGNYGVPRISKDKNGVIRNFESEKPNVEGVVLGELNSGIKYSKHESLSEWLKRSGIPGISIDDTREIVKSIRLKGVVKCVIANGNYTIEYARKMLKEFSYSMVNYALYTTPKRKIIHGDGKYRIVVIDFGIKHGILRSLERFNATVIRVPYTQREKQILDLNPDGIVLSNGPGNPNLLYKGFNSKSIIDSGIPLLGICLGHQLVAIHYKGRVEKMKYGHRAINKGVYDTILKKASITTHNHGYAVAKKPSNSKLWFYSLDDHTIEGLVYPDKNIYTVQFHPEGGPGTTDASYVFKIFMDLVKEWKAKKRKL